MTALTYPKMKYSIYTGVVERINRFLVVKSALPSKSQDQYGAFSFQYKNKTKPNNLSDLRYSVIGAIIMSCLHVANNLRASLLRLYVCLRLDHS